MTTSREVVVVGGGPAGSLITILLAQRGCKVDIHECRGDPRDARTPDDGRSINLGMSRRALDALKRVGLLDDVLRQSVPMRRRIIHQPDGTLRGQPYGSNESEILYAVRRRDLSATLINAAAGYPGVQLHFGSRLVDLDRDRSPVVARFADATGEANGGPTGATGEVTTEVRADLVVGADGAYSAVRRCLQRGARACHRQDFLAWGHKELTIPPGPDRAPRLELNALHVWPRDDAMIVAHPNRDGSMTASLFLAHEGPVSFAVLDTPERIRQFFTTRFPDVVELMPHLAEQFSARPVGDLMSVRTSPWHDLDRVVLIGDAAHAVYPFYGQGMNAALEDCVLLDQCLACGDRRAAFARFERERKRHTDILAELSEQNFIEFRDGMRSPWRLAHWRANLWLNRMFPKRWVPLYSMVSHSTIPYADAVRRARRQDRILAVAGMTLAAGAAASGGLALYRRAAR